MLRIAICFALLSGAGMSEPVFAQEDEDYSAQDFLKRGIRKRMRGDYSDAIYDFSESIRLDDTIPGVYMARGMSYLDRAIRDNRYDTLRRAEEDFDRAVYADVNNGRAYALRGFVRAMRANQRGIADIRQAQQIDSSLPPEGFAALGIFAMDARAWDQAKAFLNKGMKLVAPGFPIRGFIRRKLEEIAILERQRVQTSLTRRQGQAEIDGEAELRAWMVQLVEGDPIEREEAAKALGAPGNEQAVQALTDALRDPVLRVRAQAADSLGRIGIPRTSKALIPMITDEDKRIRAVVVRALGEIASERAKNPLKSRLGKEQEKAVRNEIRVALKKIDDAAFSMKMDLEYMLEEMSVTLD